MCSYSGSDGGGNDGNNNNGGRPQKRQRLPKRGPGVAELEKILREQEKKNDQIEGFPSCFVPSLSSNDHHLSSRPHDPTLPWTNLNNSSLSTATRRVPFVPHLDHHHQTSTTPPPQPTHVLPPPPNIYGNNGNNTSILRRVTIGGGGSAGVLNLPEHALFPVTWSTTSTTTPSDSNTTTHEGNIYYGTGGKNIALPTTDHPLWSSMQNKHYQNPNSLINQFPGYASSSSSIPSSVVLYNQIEPPSSQTSYHNYPSMPQRQEEKVVGMKRRSQSFSVDSPPGPCFQSQVPHQLLPHMHRPVDQPSHYNVELSKTMLPSTFIRDVAKSDHDPLELNLHNHATRCGAPPHHHQPNFMKFNPSTDHVPSSVLQSNSQEQQYYASEYDVPSFQGNMEEYMYSHERSEAAGPDFNRPLLYSFLISKEQMGTKENILSLDNKGSEPADGEDQGIDLNLKL